MAFRLGDLLVKRGLITPAQQQEIADHQKLSGRPFGLLAEQMYSVPPSAVEAAWVDQYAEHAERLGPGELAAEPDAAEAIEPRQAWQFGVLPLRYDKDELVAATSVERLAKAMRFAGWRIEVPCRFVLAADADLKDALTETYGHPGMQTPFDWSAAPPEIEDARRTA